MIRRKHWISFVVSCLTAISLVGCGSQETGGSTNDTLIFAVAPDGGAFSSRDSSGKLTGFDIELVESIAAKENLKVEWKEMKFNGIIPALQAKQVDGAAASITIREDRKAVTNFTDPYFDSGLVMVVKKDSPISSIDDLKDKTIVAKQGTSGLEKANELAKEKGAKVKILEDEATLYMDVEAGGSDVLINDFPFVANKIKSGTAANLKIVGDKLTGEEYGIAIAKGKEDLLEKFNKHLKEMKENGEYQKLYDKYFGSN
ncbi:basic amino acid ABC transporter substrate-binding protein [Brevibacillus gelatini]|uniref:Basic amino acid ABC transporter substrate-binding protein n=1 Tax=Brevibacillus gelatini TaxID=1655277 RepID=A0A3M8B2T6_9BACL|nr:basic amino acid ABC transporter substrate-binding protein [Brevibacillus gelatini]RNB57771.1 basic amino acid ABC transporter substrate-binding protein [Brevibacillus gelatini]